MTDFDHRRYQHTPACGCFRHTTSDQWIPDSDWERALDRSADPTSDLPRLVTVTVMPFGVIAALVERDGTILETAAEPFCDESETDL